MNGPRRVAVATVMSALAIAAPVASAQAASTLLTGQTLASGQSLTSPDGHYALTMQTDGNLVLAVANPHGSPRTLFSTGTGSVPGATATLQTSGTLVVQDPTGATVWSSNHTGSGCANLDLQDDGNLVTYDGAGTYWATNTLPNTLQPGDELLPGQVLYGYHGRALMELSGGYLQTITGQGRVWRSPSGGPSGSYAEMNPDGELELVDPEGRAVWDSGTDSANAYATVGETGNVYVNASDGKLLWDATGGASSLDGLPALDATTPLQSCPTAAPAPAPTPTPAPVTTKPVKVTLRGIDVRMAIRWHYHQRVTFAKVVTVGRFPRRAVLTITCRGRRGCPTHLVRIHRRRVRRPLVLRADGRHLRPLLHRLTTLRFRAGDVLTLTVTEHAHRTSRLQVRIRDGRAPVNRVVHG